MTIEEMRKKIRLPYPAPRWQERVDKMLDDQVVAIYMKFREKGLFNKKKEKKSKWKQTTLWDLEDFNK